LKHEGGWNSHQPLVKFHKKAADLALVIDLKAGNSHPVWPRHLPIMPIYSAELFCWYFQPIRHANHCIK